MTEKKFQSNLDVFLGIKERIKQYFYIDWTKTSNGEIPLAEWLEKKPKNITWSQILKWKNVGEIMVCCTDNKSFSLISSKIIIQTLLNNSFILISIIS